MIGLISFLVVQSFRTSAKVDRLGDQIAIVQGESMRLAERLDRLERPNRP